MNGLWLLLLWCFASTPALAQPPVSIATASSDVLKDYNLTGKATVKADGGFVEEEIYQDGAWIREGRQPVQIVEPTSRPGVTNVIQSTALYRSNGSGWTFVTATVGGNHLVGMPAPTPEEIVPALGRVNDLFPRQVGTWANIVQYFSAKLPDDPKPLWTNFRTVELDMMVSYATIEGQDLVSYVETRRVQFSRDADSGPFLRTMVLSHTPKEAQRKTVTPEEAAGALTLWEKEFVDSIQKKEIPYFATTQDVCKYAYDALMSDQSDEDVKWTLFWMMSSEYLISPSKLVPNTFGHQFLDGALEKRAEMKRMYPRDFSYQRTSGDYIYFARNDPKAMGQCRVFLLDPVVDGKRAGIVTHLEIPVGTY